MSSEWMKVMLGEIARKKTETGDAAAESARRSREQAEASAPAAAPAAAPVPTSAGVRPPE